MISNWVRDFMDEEGMEYPFAGIQAILEKADLRFSNLEVPIGTGDSLYRAEKTYTFSLDPRYKEALRHGGFEVVSLANNHIMDYGHHLADSTVYHLDELGIHSVGYGINREGATTPAIRDVGIKVGFLAYSMTFPESFWATDSTAGTAYPFLPYFKPKIQALDSQVDFTVISFHWGAENSDSTKQYQQMYAHQAIDAGADLILGHHPHIWQGVEQYKGKLIAYSLGNLCFGSYSEHAKKSGLLEVSFGPDTVYSAKIHPINVDNMNVLFQPHPMEPADAEVFFRELEYFSSRFDSISTVRISGDGDLLFNEKSLVNSTQTNVIPVGDH